MANVNYIVEREAFARHARDNGYTGNEQLLWYALFTIFNERASRNAHVWPDGFIRISNKEILSWLPFTENTLVQVRGSMVNPARHQPLLLEYIKGKRNTDMPQYRMCWFSTDVESYLNPRGNMGGNIGGNMGGNTGGNLRGNMGDIKVNINQQQAVLKPEKKIYFNQAWRTDARARRAVAQNILEAVGCEGISARANEQVCHFLEKGMTPEQVLQGLDGIAELGSMEFIGGWLKTAADHLNLPESEEDKYFA